MFKDIHWPTCILVNLVLIVLNSTLMMLLNFQIGIPFLTVIGYFISVKIGKAVKAKKERSKALHINKRKAWREYLKAHPEADPRNRNS